MKCPNCNETLLMTHRNNIEIDYCPSCRGVWLDKGELDKMLDYAAQQSNVENRDEPQDFRKYDHEAKYRGHYNKPYKKKSFLNDFFDFD